MKLKTETRLNKRENDEIKQKTGMTDLLWTLKSIILNVILQTRI